MALNVRQKKYCQERAKGKGYAEAFRDAGFGPNSTDDTRKHNAYHMERKGNQAAEIQAKIKELQRRADMRAILTREQRIALLTDIALNEDNDMPDRLRSVDQLNRMGGDYTDTVRTEVSGKIEMDYKDRIAAIKKDIDETA